MLWNALPDSIRTRAFAGFFFLYINYIILIYNYIGISI